MPSTLLITIGIKLIAILLIIFGGFMVLFFPLAPEHQPESFSISGVIIGFISLIIGAYLLFS